MHVNVICMKWGTVYGPEYVNRLYGMTARNLSRPFRFVCLTDNDDGLRGEVETAPIPDIRLDPPYRRTAWRKLVLHRAGIGGLSGPTLFFDLDIVIVGPLDPFFERAPGNFASFTTGPTPIGSWETQACSASRSAPMPTCSNASRRCPPSTGPISIATSKGSCPKPSAGTGMTYWPAEWCVSFKKHCLPRWPLNFGLTAGIPDRARIVVFHGHPNPHEAMTGEWPAPWHRRSYKYLRPVPWIADYWKE